MKRTLFLGEGATFDLPFSDLNPSILTACEIKPRKGALFKEAAAEALWKKKGTHLLLTPEELPVGVDLLNTLEWLEQEAPDQALLLFPLQSLPPHALSKEGPWVPLVEKGESVLFLYYLLLDMKNRIKGFALKSGEFLEEEMKLLLDPFTKEEGALSLLSLKGPNYFAKIKKYLS